MKNKTILFYGTPWCPDCIRSKSVLDTYNVEYQFIDISSDPNAAKRVEEINKGYRSVPTLVFSDGSVLVEPDPDTLVKKLNQNHV